MINEIKKIKVAWICHFSNADIRSMLPLSKKALVGLAKSILGRPVSNSYVDFAPWVTNLIHEFQKFDDVELHVIAPFSGLRPMKYEVVHQGVFYHFYKPDLPFLHSQVPGWLQPFAPPRFWHNRFAVKTFLKKIQPDIVNLIGTENPYYSITTLDIRDIPVYVSAQTVYTNPDRKQLSDSCIPLIWDIEMKIHQKEIYFGCTGRMHRDLILRNNPRAIIFKMVFPIEKPEQIPAVPKEFDFVFFAGLAKKKGVEDLLAAMVQVKAQKPDASLSIVGKCPDAYLQYLQARIDELGLEKNVTFAGFFPDHADMHHHIMKSTCAVLPVKLDVIPSSVIEAMHLGIPVVTCKTTGIPYLNKDGETVLIAEIGDIEALADHMLRVINSPDMAKVLAGAAKAFVAKEFDNTASARRLVENYRAVISHYHQQIPIPDCLLFNPDEYPIYN